MRLMTFCFISIIAEVSFLTATSNALENFVFESGAYSRSIPVVNGSYGEVPSVPKPAVAGNIDKEISQNDWITIQGGKYVMGVDGAYLASPSREVSVKSFAIQRTHVTVAQYAECVRAGVCETPGSGGKCNWGIQGRENHPVNCVAWEQANNYAWFRKARLPTEAEWEFAAKGGGRNVKYPWGDHYPVPGLAVYNAMGTLPVCSKPGGNTPQGLCDMAGNAAQWVEDEISLYSDNHAVDGTAFEWPGGMLAGDHVKRGGSFLGSWLETYSRGSSRIGEEETGFRLARSLKNNPLQGVPVKQVEWTTIPGGEITMMDFFSPTEGDVPTKKVNIRTFKISKTHVTVEQYAECVADNECSEPGKWGKCNWAVPGRRNHPINCVTWLQAMEYAKFKRARLPSEAEWEYAARSGGWNLYPWGDTTPNGTEKFLPLGTYLSSPVCAKPFGNTAHGLCDMAGNVFQWVADAFHDTYDDLPSDGTAYSGPGRGHVMRGGSFYTSNNPWEYTETNYTRGVGYNGSKIGFRIAK